MATKKAYVRIHSNKTIRVTCGLQNKDVTNPDAHVPDRLKVSPSWPTCCVIISSGSHLYPSEIAEWHTVKALAKEKVLTIGDFTDDDSEEPEVASKKETLVNNLKEKDIIEIKKEEKTGPKLADIAGE